MSEKLNLYDFDEYSRQPISFYYSQAGFHPDDAKPVIVWTHEDYPIGTAALSKNGTGQIPTLLDIRKLDENIWGQHEWQVDLPAPLAEGEYVLHVDFNGQSARTSPITIDKCLYESLMEKGAKHAFLKRCGIHCHTHDADLYSFDDQTFGKPIGHRDLVGGWHDAHDDNKWVALIWMTLYSLLKAEDLFHFDWKHANEPFPALLAEAWWEIEWLLKMQKPNGSFYTAVTEWYPEHRKDGPFMAVYNHDQNYDSLHQDRRALVDAWGEGRLCSLWRIPSGSFPSTAPKYFAYIAHALRCFARLIREYDAKIAKQCEMAAGKTIDYLENLQELPAYQELEVNAGLALFHLECAKEAGNAESLRTAERWLERVLAMQQSGGFFHSSTRCRGLEAWPEEAGDERVFLDYPFGYMFPIIEYLDMASVNENLEFQLVDRARASLAAFATMLDGFCRATAFCQPAELRFDRQPQIILDTQIAHHGYNAYILSAGVMFSAAERLAGHPGGRYLAERQLQWVLGANPRFMSFMNGLGERNSGQYAACATTGAVYSRNPGLMAYYRQIRDMRWGVTTGMYGPKQPGGNDSFRRPDMVFPQMPNYPNAGQSMNGRYDNLAQETWLNTTGWLIMLSAELERQHFKQAK